MWPLFALLSAVFATFRKTSERKLASQLHHFTIGWCIQLSALPFMVLGLVLFGRLFNPFSLHANFWIPTILTWFGFYPLSTYLYLQSLKHGELSKTLPLQGLSPVISSLFGLVFLHQHPTLKGIACIILVALGVYCLNITGRQLHNPLHTFTKNRGNLFALGSLLMGISVGTLDSIAIRASEALYHTVVCTIGAAIILRVLAWMAGEGTELPGVQHRLPLLRTGMFFAVTYGAYSLALAQGPLAYTGAVRSAGICVGSVMAGRIAGETITRPKIIGLACILAGSTVLSII